VKARDTSGLASYHTAIVAETNLATINLALAMHRAKVRYFNSLIKVVNL
jgi:hypothetical protein